MSTARKFVKTYYANAFVRNAEHGKKFIDTGFITFPVCETTESAWKCAMNLTKKDLASPNYDGTPTSLRDVAYNRDHGDGC